MADGIYTRSWCSKEKVIFLRPEGKLRNETFQPLGAFLLLSFIRRALSAAASCGTFSCLYVAPWFLWSGGVCPLQPMKNQTQARGLDDKSLNRTV